MKTSHRSERGQAIILIMLAVVGLIGITGLAVDGGLSYSERRRAQNAADTTALDSALAKVRGQNIYTEGLARAATNNYVDSDPGSASSSANVNVEIYNPPANGAYSCANNAAHCNEYVQVYITTTIGTFFGRVVGITQTTNKVMAVAHVIPPTTAPLAFGNAVVGLSPSDCKAVTYQGSASVDLIGSGIFVNSKCADAAFFNNSNSPGTDLTAPCLSSVGGITYNPGSLDVPAECISSGAAPWVYPPVDLLPPTPVCNGSVTQSGDTLSPGNYDDNQAFPPNGVEHLQSGTYCINNADFNVAGNSVLEGEHVLIYVKKGSVTWNGGATIKLSAPDSGPFAGLLLYLPLSNSSTVKINGNGDSSISGSILAPSSNIVMQGGGGTDGLHCQVVGYTVDLGGSSYTKLVYNAGEQYHPPIPPTIELVQ